MAEVTITLTDADKGVLLKVNSGQALPEGKESGTPAENLALIALHCIGEEYRLITGREMQPIKLC